MDYTLREFLGEQVPDPQWQGVDRNTLARLTVGMSIAAILDALGRSIEDSASYQYPRDAGVHSFFYNGKNYEFSRGEFPVYDALQDYFKAAQEWDVAGSAESALENRPTIGAELEGQIKVFAEEAMGYLSQGDW